MTRDDFFSRLATRLKHGLATQELLDRLARRGLFMYPYQLVQELPLERPLTAPGETFRTRFLEAHEIGLVSDIVERPRRLEGLEARLTRGRCFGVFDGDTLAAYSWYMHDYVPTAAGGYTLCPLPETAAYLYDAYVCRQYRGQRLAGYMRHELHHALRALGKERFVSISLTFNRSTRRFKARLGADEFESRLLLSPRRGGGIDIRLRRRKALLATPRALRVRAESPTSGRAE